MILKIERYTWSRSTKDWWMLDDIRKVKKILIREVPFENPDELPNNVVFDFEQYLKDHLNKEGQIVPDKRNVIELICELSNSDEFVVLFDTTAYLCNDGGKTIERMVANYR